MWVGTQPICLLLVAHPNSCFPFPNSLVSSSMASHFLMAFACASLYSYFFCTYSGYNPKEKTPPFFLPCCSWTFSVFSSIFPPPKIQLSFSSMAGISPWRNWTKRAIAVCGIFGPGQWTSLAQHGQPSVCSILMARIVSARRPLGNIGCGVG